jgi:hypothetical protein
MLFVETTRKAFHETALTRGCVSRVRRYGLEKRPGSRIETINFRQGLRVLDSRFLRNLPPITVSLLPEARQRAGRIGRLFCHHRLASRVERMSVYALRLEHHKYENYRPYRPNPARAIP